MIKIGLKHTSELTVTDAVTAIKVGSGDKFWRWHINFCPGWKAYFTSQSEEKKGELRTKYNFQKY